MVKQPTGTVTLLFSDVEGSTALLVRLGAARYAEVLALHRQVLREAFVRHDGYEVDEEGDAFLVAFAGAGAAVAAAREAQEGLLSVEWPEGVALRVRMGIHSGEPLPVPPKYVGIDVHRAARIMAAGHGGQVLVSDTAAALLDEVPLRDLGPQRLKDLLEPVRLFQLLVDGLPDEFPPLRSLHRTNLPTAAWPLLGREHELASIRTLVADGVHLMTLTGPGGSGKTRLALQAAAELSDEFADGVFFVPLAPLRETAVGRAVAEAIGLQPDDDVAAWLRAHDVLLLLDNLEHLAGVDAEVGELLVGETTILATSRTPLRLAAERELPVEPLADKAAVELFVSRAAAAGRALEPDETLAAVCRRLDNLPLALELAAARAKLLSPAALLQRLDTALPLLTGGASDRPERQRTLRATIEWSHDLLEPKAQAAFRRLSVFRGSFTLDTAESVSDAGLDCVAALLDQSLLKPLGEERFFLLETLREYARERLEEADETRVYTVRHARHYRAELEARATMLAGQRLTWFAAEEDNLRAMLDELVAGGAAEAAEATELLGWYWRSRGAYLERQSRLRVLLARDELPEKIRPELLLSLASTASSLGDDAEAQLAAEAALALGEPGSRSPHYIHALLMAARAGDSEIRARRAREAVDLARDLDDQMRLSALIDAGVTLADAGYPDEARAITADARDGFIQIGSEVGAAVAAENTAWLDLGQGEFEAAEASFAATVEIGRALGHVAMEVSSLRGLGLALLCLGRRGEARVVFSTMLQMDQRAGPPSVSTIDAIAGIALAADTERAHDCARLRGAVTHIRRTRRRDWQLGSDDIERDLEASLTEVLGVETWNRETEAGATMSLEKAIELARSLAGRRTRDGPEGPFL